MDKNSSVNREFLPRMKREEFHREMKFSLKEPLEPFSNT